MVPLAIDQVLHSVLCWVNSTVAGGYCVKLNEMGIWKMNERIEQLVEQAGFGSYAEIPDTYVVHKNDLVEFAELIVEECMSMCDELKVEYFNHRKNTMDFDEKHIYAEGESACFNLRFKMKKHFGVEE